MDDEAKGEQLATGMRGRQKVKTIIKFARCVSRMRCSFNARALTSQLTYILRLDLDTPTQSAKRSSDHRVSSKREARKPPPPRRSLSSERGGFPSRCRGSPPFVEAPIRFVSSSSRSPLARSIRDAVWLSGSVWAGWNARGLSSGCFHHIKTDTVERVGGNGRAKGTFAPRRSRSARHQRGGQAGEELGLGTGGGEG